MFGITSIDISAQEQKELLEISDEKLEMLDKKIPGFKSRCAETESYGFHYFSDGLKIKAYMSVPKAEGVYPVIIFNRGGNRNFGELNDIRAMIILNELAANGYVALASNYRGSSESEGQEEFGGADVHDILNLIPVASTVEKADTSRMGLFGWSRGGMMTYKTLMESCKFKAAVVGAGMANMFRSAEERPEMESGVFAELIPNFENNRDEELRNRSAVYNIDKLCNTTPILILHGSSDWRVSPKDALQMADSLYAHKHPFRLHFYEGGDHGLNEFDAEVSEAVISFMNDYLKDQREYPDMTPHGK